ncbi:MAG TPA: patatin-like phospholipase family protein [Nitrososphaeraceae archaeon]
MEIDIKMPPPAKQRVLVFQGGGSLGAYEAGVYHVLYHWIKRDLPQDENVFDIIAGTSIGAVNASIVINEILEKKKQEKLDEIIKYWENTPEKLIQFWRSVSKSNAITYLWDPWNIPDFYRSFTEKYLNLNYDTYLNAFPFLRSFLPSEESFRKYYHTQMALASGEKHIFRPEFIYPFPTPVWNKFFDYISPTALWFQYSNLPLRNSIADSASMLNDNETNGIKTQYSEKEPRLLLIAVDIREGETRTFDSYNENITINHVLASAAVPKHYAYVAIDGNKYWDGGILSNTPVREVLSEHSKFWVDRLGLELGSKIDFEKEKEWFKKDNEDEQNKNKNKKIPKLELCIVNLYPSKETGQQIPSLYDYDLTKDRENDIRFHDKTDYDLKLANVVTDYHDFVESVGEVAIEAIEGVKDKKIVVGLKKKLTDILNRPQRTLTREEKPRYYYDLLRKRFNIEGTIKIERQDDIHTIANKALDFSPETITKLIEQGVYDTLNNLYQVHKGKDKELFKKWLNKYIKEIEKQNIKDILEPVLQFKEKEGL